MRPQRRVDWTWPPRLTVLPGGDGEAAPAPGLMTVLAWAAPLTALALFGVVLLRTAWLSDDAYITLRTIDNLLHGYGLTWNTLERVQTYTHPLWLLILTPLIALSGEVFFTTQLLAIFLALAALALLVSRMASGPPVAFLVVAIAISSRALVDFSTAGLENPLSHLLIVLVAMTALGQRFGPPTSLGLAVASGLLLLNRADLVWLVAPILIVRALATTWRERWLMLAGAGGPLALWTLFSLFYYGFPWPNTAYAKLGTGIAREQLIGRGLIYLGNSLTVDTVTLLTIAAALIVSLTVRRHQQWPLAVGLVLHLAYVVAIGGDFMTGRFLTAPLVLALALLAPVRLPSRLAIVAAGLVVGLGLSGVSPPLLSPLDYGRTSHRSARLADPDKHGFVDERAYYYPVTSLLTGLSRPSILPDHGWSHEGQAARDAGAALEVRGTVGLFGYFAGPQVHVLDTYALGDPLLARLPASPNPHWRPGHFERDVPRGYPETVMGEENRILDPALARYYDHLRLVTRGPLLSGERLWAIWRFNTDGYNDLLALYRPELAPPLDLAGPRQEVTLPMVQTIRRRGAAWNAPGHTLLGPAGVRINLGQRVTASTLEVSVDHNDQYRLVLANDTLAVGEAMLGPQTDGWPGLVVYRVNVPAAAVAQGYTHIIVVPVAGDERYVLGHLRLLP